MRADTPLDHPREIYTPFDARETQRLLGFVADVEEFASSSFFQRSGLRASMTVGVGNAGTGFNVSTEIDEVAEESVRAVVPIFRQLYSHTEPTSFAQVFSLLAQHVRAQPSQRQSDALAALKEFRRAEKQILRGDGAGQLIMDNEVLSPRVLIDLFLHGHYLHKGNEKSEKLARWPFADLTRFQFFSAVVQLRNLYWPARNVVLRILEQRELVSPRRAA